MLRSLALAISLCSCTVVRAHNADGSSIHAFILGQGNITAGEGPCETLPPLLQADSHTYITAVNYTDSVTIISAIITAAAAYFSGL